MHSDNNPDEPKEFDTNAGNPQGDKNLLWIQQQKKQQQSTGEFDTSGGKHKGDDNQLWRQSDQK